MKNLSLSALADLPRASLGKMGQDGCGATLPPESVPVKIRQIWREWHPLVRFQRPPDVPLDILLSARKEQGHTSRWPGGERRSPEAVFRAAGKMGRLPGGAAPAALADERRGKKARGRNPPVPIFNCRSGRSDRCRPLWRRIAAAEPPTGRLVVDPFTDGFYHSTNRSVSWALGGFYPPLRGAGHRF